MVVSLWPRFLAYIVYPNYFILALYNFTNVLMKYFRFFLISWIKHCPSLHKTYQKCILFVPYYTISEYFPT